MKAKVTYYLIHAGVCVATGSRVIDIHITHHGRIEVDHDGDISEYPSVRLTVCHWLADEGLSAPAGLLGLADLIDQVARMAVI